MKARNTLLFRLFLIYEAVFAVAIPIILLATWLSKGGLQVQGVFYAFLVSLNRDLSMRLGLLLFLLIVSTSANAAVLSAVVEQTVDGQNFSFDFAVDPVPAVDSAIFTIHARGDYVQRPGGNGSETLDWNIDGLLFGGPVGDFTLDYDEGSVPNGVGGPFHFTYVHGCCTDIEFARSYEISDALLIDILADGQVNIFVDLADRVQLKGGNEEVSFVGVSLRYNVVPIPAPVWLFGSALAGLGWFRRKQTT